MTAEQLAEGKCHSWSGWGKYGGAQLAVLTMPSRHLLLHVMLRFLWQQKRVPSRCLVHAGLDALVL